MRIAFGFALIAILFGACGDDLEGETLIGATCAKSAECGVAGVCVMGAQGLCSRKCQFPGALQECPLGSYCHTETVETSEETLHDLTLCFPSCKADPDCREGYECTGASGGSGKVCVPSKD
jgi:hypothetical protein